MSDDEEDCFDEYKHKGLIRKSAYFECPSLDHNKMSPAIRASWVYNYNEKWWDYDVVVIPDGVIVLIQATRCDGEIECWNGEDEAMCGFNNFVIFGAGNLPHFY